MCNTIEPIRYYIFGSEVCRALEEGGIKKALKKAKIEGFDLFVENISTESYEILRAYEGWEGWAIITKEQYNEFLKLT